MGNQFALTVFEGQQPPTRHMDADEVRRCRLALGMSRAEFALALRLPQYGNQAVGDWENGSAPIPGPVSLAIEYLLYLTVAGEPLPAAYMLPRSKNVRRAQ